MSTENDYADQFQRRLARRRKITALVAVGLAALGGIGTVVVVNAASIEPKAPTPAPIDLVRGESAGFAASCPQGWTMRTGRTWHCSHPTQSATMCVIIPEPLGRSMTPSNYWEAARATVKSMLGDEMRPGAGSGAYQVDGRSTYRAVVDGPMPQLVYVYTEDETAYVVSCNAQRPHFDGLVASFDAIGQSLELGGSD